ncbi:MAG: hypothetical protein ABL927_01350 [Bdellovibrionales bacterium]
MMKLKYRFLVLNIFMSFTARVAAGYVFIWLMSAQSFGFVENVTHGYVNCMACHVSPAGGGLLNDYGRSLSKELMSTWGWKNSEQPIFGAVKNSDSFKLGGDYRTIQTYFKNSQVKQGKQFVMQKNIELGFTNSKVSLVGTVGEQEGPSGTPKKDEFLSERHYLLWDVTDEIKLRAGKFRLNVGLNDPNHTRVTKAPLGFGPNSESYILEFSKFSEVDEIFVSSDMGRIDIPGGLSSEKSISINYGRYLTEKAKAGTSVFFGESEIRRRSLFGFHGVTGLFGDYLLKYEADYQQSRFFDESRKDEKLFASVVTFGYQALKGFFPYVSTEYLQSNLSDNSTQQTSGGIGIQWLPIPHIELQAEYKKQNNKNSDPERSDSAWLLAHIYL